MHFVQVASFLLPALAQAQTFTSCDPTKKTCGSDTGLNQASYTVDFTDGENDDWTMTYNKATYDENGVGFTINSIHDAPTMQSEFYFFFGSVSAIAKASPGEGIVSCVILESDDLDEIDWEWLGGSNDEVQTNYFGKGNTTSYDRGSIETVDNSQGEWHNYTIEWTSAYTTWWLDGAPLRTLNYADAVGGKNYPQTPMRVKLGSWSVSTAGNEGTITCAGGETNFDEAPFTMYVKEITINNYNPASTYTYGDKSGSFESIELDKEGATGSDTNHDSGAISDTSNTGNISVSSEETTASSTASTARPSSSGTASSATTATSSSSASHTTTSSADPTESSGAAATSDAANDDEGSAAVSVTASAIMLTFTAALVALLA